MPVTISQVALIFQQKVHAQSRFFFALNNNFGLSVAMIKRMILCMFFLICSCSENESEKTEKLLDTPVQDFLCRDCHSFSLDRYHNQIHCNKCHAGTEPANSADEAHSNLIAYPAHPEAMEKSCSPCHPDQHASAAKSIHFTLVNEVNTVRSAFGAQNTLASLVEIPQHEEISTEVDLAEDMLRRRCLRCHLYSSGDQYTETLHGTGCAACHLEFASGKMVSHAFIKSPPDSQCLHCHYGNFVGADYYGRYEHDYHWDYRTPYLKDGTTSRPYGVEFHQLSEDIHKTAGLSCIDCHRGAELMSSNAQKITCSSCHLRKQGDALPTPNTIEQNGTLIVHTLLSDRKLLVPQAVDPAHDKYKGQAACPVCHAQWSFTDEGTHLFRIDAEEFEPWGALYVQGSREVEKQIETSLYGEESFPYVFMTDTISNELYTGIWFKGFELRRWEFPIICRDNAGRFQVCRPLLDLHLSFVDENEELIFDGITPTQAPPAGLLPYTPHTTGKAGAFYMERLRENSELLTYPLNLDKTTAIQEPAK